jgi:hypothetical protein
MAVSDPLRELKTLGRDMAQIPLARLPTSYKKVAFLCVNSYTSYRLNLGTGPINDAISFAKCVKRYDFEIYFLHNPHAQTFLRYLDSFFKAASSQLIIYYVGHGTGVIDTTGDESDHQDEAFVFDDGVIIDDELISHLAENKHPASKVILVTDACHSGTIWDIQSKTAKGKKLPPSIISISAATDAQTAKQTTLNQKDQGIFTFNLAKTLTANPWLTPTELRGKMKAILKKYSQSFTVGTTSATLLNQPLFS